MTNGPLERPWLPGQLNRVDEIEALPENWDSYHALQPAPLAAHISRSLLHVLSAWHTVRPKVRPQLCPTVEGGIQIVWREQGYELDVEIAPDGQIETWLHRNSDGAEMSWPPEQPDPDSTP